MQWILKDINKKQAKNFKSDFLRFSVGKRGQTTIFQMYISLQPFKVWLWLGYHLKAYGLLFPLMPKSQFWNLGHCDSFCWIRSQIQFTHQWFVARSISIFWDVLQLFLKHCPNFSKTFSQYTQKYHLQDKHQDI